MGTIRLLQNEARDALELFQQEQTPALRLQGIALALHALGESEEAELALNRLVSEWGDEWPEGVAAVHAWSGDADAAFEWLSRRDPAARNPVFGGHISPLYQSLHSDPRWQTYLAGMGLSDEQLTRIEFETTYPDEV